MSFCFVESWRRPPLAVRVVPAPRCGYRAEMRFSLRAFRWCQGAPPPLSGPFRGKGPEPGQVKSRLLLKKHFWTKFYVNTAQLGAGRHLLPCLVL